MPAAALERCATLPEKASGALDTHSQTSLRVAVCAPAGKLHPRSRRTLPCATAAEVLLTRLVRIHVVYSCGLLGSKAKAQVRSGQMVPLHPSRTDRNCNAGSLRRLTIAAIGAAIKTSASPVTDCWAPAKRRCRWVPLPCHSPGRPFHGQVKPLACDSPQGVLTCDSQG
jgi:hypothetical protein